MSEGRAALLIAIALLVCGWSVFSSGLIDVELDSVQALKSAPAFCCSW